MSYGRLVGKKERLYVPIGAGNALKYGISGGAALLDIARRAGLPVPPGIILVDEAYRRALGNGLIRLEPSGALSAPDATRLAFALAFPNFEWELPGPFSFYTAFSGPDGLPAPNAPLIAVRDEVDGRDSAQLSEALCATWAASPHPEGDFRRDLVMIRSVRATHRGTALSEAAYEDDLIVPDGEEMPLTLPKLRGREGGKSGANWRERLRILLRDVRAVFAHRRSGRDWEIRYADDGERCWLLQIRPVTTLSQRDDPFVEAQRAAFGSALGPSSPLMTALFVAAGAQAWAAYHALDRNVQTARPLIEAFFGRPYLNVAIVAEMLRLWGLSAAHLPEKLRAAGLDFPAQPGRTLRSLIPARRWRRVHLPTQPDPDLKTAAGAVAALQTALAEGLIALIGGQDGQAATARADRARAALLEIAARTIPEADQVWLLTVEEAAALDSGPTHDPALLAARAAAWEAHAAAVAPDVLRRHTAALPTP